MEKVSYPRRIPLIQKLDKGNGAKSIAIVLVIWGLSLYHPEV